MQLTIAIWTYNDYIVSPYLVEVTDLLGCSSASLARYFMASDAFQKKLNTRMSE